MMMWPWIRMRLVGIIVIGLLVTFQTYAKGRTDTNILP